MPPPPPGHIEARFVDEKNNIDRFSETFKRNIDRVLKDTERKLIQMLEEYAAGNKNRAIDIGYALDVKNQLQSVMMQAGYYRSVDAALSKYADVIKEVRKNYEMFGNKVTFTEVDRRIISELMKTDVQDFQDIGKSIQNDIYRSLTDSVLTNTDISGGVEAVRGALANSDLAKHAYTYMNTAYMNFNRRVNNIAVENTGWAEVIYMGPLDDVTRPFCRHHVNEVMKLEDVKKLRNDQGGNAYTDGGGYNCRHRWVAVPPTYKDSAEYGDLQERTREELKDI